MARCHESDSIGTALTEAARSLRERAERVQQAAAAFHDRYHAAVHGSAQYPDCDCELAKVLREVERG